MHFVANADSPWGNGRCERHGGLLKDMIDKLADTSIIDSPAEVDIALAEQVSLKNRSPHRGGSGLILEYLPSCSRTTT